MERPGVAGELRVRSQREPWRSCGGYELLAQVIAAAQSDSTSEGSMCALQRELHGVAAQLGAQLSGADGGAPGSFSVLQDCTAPPCCAHELVDFGAAHPQVTVLVDPRRPRASPPRASRRNVPLPPNVWTLAPSESAAGVRSRRQAARACGGGCTTVQIAHGLQGHPLLPLLDAAHAARGGGASGGADVNGGEGSDGDSHGDGDGGSDGGGADRGLRGRGGRSLLSVRGTDDALATAQEAAAESLLSSTAAGRGGSEVAAGNDAGVELEEADAPNAGGHFALLRAAKRARGGQRVVARQTGAAVGGPASTAADRHTDRLSAANQQTEVVVATAATRAAPPAASAHTANGQGEGRDVPRRGATSGTTPPPAAHADARRGADDRGRGRRTAPVTARPPTDGEDEARGTATSAGGATTVAEATAQHLVALGHLLRAAKRTLLLLPAAEMLTAALDAATARGLPHAIASQLRSLLPYITAREAERLLVDAVTAADGGAPGTGTVAPLQTLRVAGAAQKAAHAAGHVLVLVLADEPQKGQSAREARTRACAPLPHARSCVAAAAAAAAGGLLLSGALARQLDRPAVCRLRAAFGRVPLSLDMRPTSRQWRLLGGTVIAAGGGPEAVLPSAAAGLEADKADKTDKAGETTPADGGALSLDELLPAAYDVLRALAAAETALRRRGLCASEQHPIVLASPRGAAHRVGACASTSSGGAAGAPAGGTVGGGARCVALDDRQLAGPTVLCADGVCRPTFVHCYRAAPPAPTSAPAGEDEPGDILAHALPACASAERRRRLELALPHAARLLTALAEYHAADAALFPGVCV